MAEQRDATWLKSAPPEEIVRAKEAGELDEYLNTPNRPMPPTIDAVSAGQRDGAWVKTATPEQISEALARGELSDYLAS